LQGRAREQIERNDCASRPAWSAPRRAGRRTIAAATRA